MDRQLEMINNNGNGQFFGNLGNDHDDDSTKVGGRYDWSLKRMSSNWNRKLKAIKRMPNGRFESTTEQEATDYIFSDKN